MQAFIFKQQTWERVEDQNSSQISSQSPPASSEPTISQAISLKTISRLISSQKCDEYNRGIELFHQFFAQTEQKDIRELATIPFSYLLHCKPLRYEDFPTYIDTSKSQDPSYRQVSQFYLSSTIPSPQKKHRHFSFRNLYQRPSQKITLKILCCFTGKAGKLNVIIPSFHGHAIQYFDGIIYFFDVDNDLYHKRQNELVYQIKLAQKFLKNMGYIADVSFLGTSGGSTTAIKMSRRFQKTKSLAFSPFITNDDFLHFYIYTQGGMVLENTRTFYSSTHPWEQENYYFLKKHLQPNFFREHVFDLSEISNSHATLATLMLTGKFPENLRWLSE